MLSRVIDIVVSAIALVLALPLIVLGIAGIKLTSPGPAFYHAQRMGRFERPFSMHKLRTMHIRPVEGAQITGPNDQRIFGLGKLLRLTKIDELPQLWNVLVGEMSFVGPRPEAVDIVERHYTGWMKETLRVRPGITSPGAVFGYRFGNRLLDDADPEGSYLVRMLAPKLAIERAYIDKASLVYDFTVINRTAWAIICESLGWHDSALPPEAAAASKWYDFTKLEVAG